MKRSIHDKGGGAFSSLSGGQVLPLTVGSFSGGDPSSTINISTSHSPPTSPPPLSTTSSSSSSSSSWSPGGPLLDLPMGVVLTMLSFLDADGLMACSQTCLELWEMCDYNGLWEGLANHLYPPSRHAQDLPMYHNDPKALVLDRNRRHRVLCFEFDVADVERADRRYSPVYQLEGFSFQLIVDPAGNGFIQMTRPGVSVYLSCCPTDRVLGTDPNDGRMLVREAAGAQGEEEEEEDWQCCAAFSLTVHNAQKIKKDQTWYSNLTDDRFYPGCREWGVHRLLSLRRLREHANGWLDDKGCLRVIARLRLLHLGLKILTTPCLQAHEGFGVVDATTTKGSPHHQQPPRSSNAVLYLEVPQCIRLSALRWRVASSLGLASPDHVRLWVMTQPWAESVSAPRALLREPMGGGQGEVSPLVLSLVANHMDGINEVRLWAEVGGDGGFEQPSAAEAAVSAAVALYDSKEGVLPRFRRTVAGAVLHQPTMMPEPVTNFDTAEPPPPPNVPDPWFVLFLKWCSGGADGRLRHLTHVVVKADMPLIHIFRLVSTLIADLENDDPNHPPRSPLPVSRLLAFKENPPALWQAYDDEEDGGGGIGANLDKMRVPTPSEQEGEDDDKTTLRDAGIENGQILCFCAHDGMEDLRQAYARVLSSLMEQALTLYYKTGSKASIMQESTTTGTTSSSTTNRLKPRLSFDALTDLFERLGHQRFRIRNAYHERQHKDARDTLEYAIIGRHLNFCCDFCGDCDFTGKRYKCTQCFDYDLCSKCHAKASESSFSHRYRFDHREWRREDFTAHQSSHVMHIIPAIPHSLDVPAIHHKVNQTMTTATTTTTTTS